MKDETLRIVIFSSFIPHTSSLLFLLQARAGMTDGQALASAFAARRQHPASAFALHAVAKAVRAGAFQSFGLIRSFHNDSNV